MMMSKYFLKCYEKVSAKTQRSNSKELAPHPNPSDLSVTRMHIHNEINSLEISDNEQSDLLERNVDRRRVVLRHRGRSKE
jgi:hypothetical protein